MTINSESILSQLRSHALRLGVFGKVYGAEPTTATAIGHANLSCAYWVQSIAPWMDKSGLSVTAAKVTCVARLYMPAQAEPRDAIDPAMSHAVDLLLTSYSADFEMTGDVGTIWLAGLIADAGYIQYEDGSATERIYTITIPIKVNDAWEQSP